MGGSAIFQSPVSRRPPADTRLFHRTGVLRRCSRGEAFSSPLPRLLFERDKDRLAQTLSLRPWSEIAKPYFAAPVKKPKPHYLIVCFRDDAEIIFRG